MSEASVSYAALILADAGVEITSDNLLSVTKAAGASVDDVWANVYAKALEGRDLKELLFSFAAAPAAGASSGAAAGSSAAVEEEAAKEESEAEESDDDMGMGLFD